MLPDAIEELYRVHRDVPLDPDVSYCDHCLGPDDVEKLRRTPLRELSADATRLLLMNAPVGTLGGATYFRHFLPRVLELAVRGDIWAPMLPSGLRLALEESDPPQRSAILEFLRAWWSHTLSTWPSPLTADELFGVFAQSDLPLRPYLDDWSAAGSVAAARHLADYLAGGVVIGMPERDAWLTSGAASAVIRAALPQTTDQAELLDTLVILDWWENHFDE